jgi:hypothetical protein
MNKRVSRIAANIPLFNHKLCPLSFIDVPEQAYIEGTLGGRDADGYRALPEPGHGGKGNCRTSAGLQKG